VELLRAALVALGRKGALTAERDLTVEALLCEALRALGQGDGGHS
jgi:hypothetical protein